MSYVDAVVIAACVRRPVRFVMDHRIFRVPLLSFIFRTMRTIPIAPAKEDAAMKERAFAEVAQALRDGEIVGIFPEGKLTDTGELNPFRPGIQQIIDDDAGAGRADGAARALGQLLQPLVRAARRCAACAASSRASRSSRRRRCRPTRVTLEALQATVLALRGERR